MATTFADAFWGSTKRQDDNTIRDWYLAIQDEIRNQSRATMCFGSPKNRLEALNERADFLVRVWRRRGNKGRPS